MSSSEAECYKFADIVQEVWDEHRSNRNSFSFALRNLLHSKNIYIVKKYLGWANEKFEKIQYVNVAFNDTLEELETLMNKIRPPKRQPD